MLSKVIEIRDSATYIPALAIKPSTFYDNTEPSNTSLSQIAIIRHALGRAGYAVGTMSILLVRLDTSEAHSDVYDWKSNTMREAHNHIEANFDSLYDGCVVDVEFITKKTSVPKTSDAFFIPS